ncbi:MULTISPECIES: hypothetical protein [Sphingomonadales]|uniref:hypothetical protein n=1 Tax=Sphingomonadales TaxID=204457 RepID=UPI000824AFE5|nr:MULTISPECIES: hypothetical protein [Sphingomonadales]MEE4212762.1 hypothetical protein [Parvularcula sp.]CAH0498524.1 hypothetical protein NVSP9465_03612 [Novosphingobium sp. CECT 9465]
MSSKRLDTLADLVRHGLNAQVECLGCHRVVIVPAATLRDRCFAKSIPMKLEIVARHLRCSCGHRGTKLDATGVQLSPP